jgi:hypothetical protein
MTPWESFLGWRLRQGIIEHTLRITLLLVTGARTFGVHMRGIDRDLVLCKIPILLIMSVLP